MRSLLRIEYDDAIYHIISRGVARLPTFIDGHDYRDFLERISAVVDDEGLVVYAFCLMPNHFHLLARTPRAGLSRWISRVIGPYARHFNTRHERSGYLWQGRYRAILVEDGSHLVECTRYIHLNPCNSRRLEEITLPEQYRWSSYRRYISGRGEGDFIDAEHVFSVFGEERPRLRRMEYRKYVESWIGRDDCSPEEGSGTGPVFGSEAFAKEVGARVAEQKKCNLIRQPQARALVALAQPSPEDICSLVDGQIPEAPYRHRRKIKAYLLKKHSRRNDHSIGALLDVHRTCVGKAMMRLEREISGSTSLRNTIGELERQLMEL